MVTFKALLLELLILANYYWYKTQSEEIVFQIGALLSSEEVLEEFKKVVPENITVNDKIIRFEPMGQVMKENSLQTYKQVCAFVSQSRGYLCSLVVSHPRNEPDLPPLSASFTAAFFDIPVIGVTARQSTFSDKNSHKNFVRTIPPYSQEGVVFVQLIQEFHWKYINVIYSDDHEGKTLLTLLEMAASAGRFTIQMQKSLKKGANFTEILWPIAMGQSRVVILYCQTKMAEEVYDAAQRLNMLGKDWAWMVTQPALKAPNLPPGVLGIRLKPQGETENMMDGVMVVKKGVMEAVKKRPSVFRKKLFDTTCESSNTQHTFSSKKEGLPLLLQYIRNVEFYRNDGDPVSFNQLGDREQAKYMIMNNAIDPNNGSLLLRQVGLFEMLSTGETIGFESKNPGSLEVSMKKIYWPPGNQQYKQVKEECLAMGEHKICQHKETRERLTSPKSFKKKTHLKVVTIEETPFVYKRDLKEGESCDTSSDPKIPKKEVLCTHTDPVTKVSKNYCCFGYCIDLLRRLANRTVNDETDSTDMENSFSYDLHLVGDGKIGDPVMQDGKPVDWTGIVKEIYTGQADLGVSPMSITPERALRIEFTKPFKYLGLTILVKRESHPKSNLASFLQPFANTLWVLVFLSVHVVALVLYLLDRFSPFGRYKFARGADTEEDALNLSSAMWFAWGVLLNSGIGEGTPRSFSARVLGMVWAGFAMIIVASYTANLAAFLVLDRPEALLSGIDDARLRNPQKDFKFATVKDSHVEAYFKSQLEYDTMLRTMTKNVYHTPEAAIEAVKNGELKAFIWDSTRLEFEAAMECDLKTAGEVFGRTGYGLAMQKDSPWLYEISQSVLNFHERGVMETLDSEWILQKPKGCPNTDTSPATLGLTNMAGVFIMVAAGIVAGVFLIFIEMAYKKRTGLKEKELELARNAADRWRGNIEKRKILRKTMAAERMEKQMPLISGGGVSTYPHHFAFNNPTYGRQRDCPKRVVHLTNQNGIFAEQPSIDRV